MKLIEIALPTTGRTQGSTNQQVDPNTLLSLRNVCQRGGKNPNTFELLTICRLLQTLKDGSFYKQSNPLEVNMSTSKELMDILRAMSPEDLCKITAKLNALLDVKDADAYYAYANPAQEYLMWLQFVQSREANESVKSNKNPLSEVQGISSPEFVIKLKRKVTLDELNKLIDDKWKCLTWEDPQIFGKGKDGKHNFLPRSFNAGDSITVEASATAPHAKVDVLKREFEKVFKDVGEIDD